MINGKYIVYFLSMISFLFCLFRRETPGYEYLFALPLFFGLIGLFFAKIFEILKNSIVFNLLLLQMLVRYCIVPLLMTLGNYRGNGYNSPNGNVAIFYMVLELFFVFLILFFSAARQREIYNCRMVAVHPLKGSVHLYFLLLGLFIYIYTSGYLSKVNFFWNLGSYVQQYVVGGEEIQDTGYAGILFTPFKVLLAIFLISQIWRSRKITIARKKFGYLVIVLSASIFIIGTSRLSILRFAFPLLILVTSILDKRDSRKIIILAVIGLIPIIFMASLAKFTRNETKATSETLFSASSLNAYFAGPGNVASGLDAYYQLKEKSRFLYLINDISQNIPGLSRYSNAAYQTNVDFNNQIYGTWGPEDQIVPLSTSGIFHFGLVGGFLYAPFLISLALFWERLSLKETFLGYKYVFISLSITFSMVFMLNISSLYFSLVATILFIYLPLFIINKLQLLR